MHKYIKEPFPAISHFIGVLLSVFGLVALIEASGSNTQTLIVCIVYGLSLIALFLASACTHGIHCSKATETLIEKADYAAIYLLIAGTYTPVSLLIIKGQLGAIILTTEWILAIIGIVSTFRGGQQSRVTSVVIYLVMGWLFLFALGSISANISNNLLAWLIGGGIFYSVGTIFFLTNKPNLFSGKFTAHDMWHIFVMGGSGCHFMLVNELVKAAANTPLI